LGGQERRRAGCSAERVRRARAKARRCMSETILDLRGLRCPQPVLHAKKAIRNLPVGGVLILECTDPLTVIDVPHFVNQTGHLLAAQDRRGELYVFRIVKQR
jgi:tRNA 2-thiouridine synthesizing protein A